MMRKFSYLPLALVLALPLLLASCTGLPFGGGTATTTVTPQPASVPPAGPLPVAQINVNPGVITPAGTATLSWNAANASNIVINNGIGPVGQSGSRPVSPNSTTDYSITATNAVGTVTSMVRLVVAPVGLPPSANPPGDRNWLASTYTHEYHWPSCSIAQNIPPPSRIWFETVNQAQANGFHPCPVCRPPN